MLVCFGTVLNYLNRAKQDNYEIIKQTKNMQLVFEYLSTRMTTILGSKYCQAFLCTDIIITFKLSIRVRAGCRENQSCALTTVFPMEDIFCRPWHVRYPFCLCTLWQYILLINIVRLKKYINNLSKIKSLFGT